MPATRIIWSPTAVHHFSEWIRFIAKDSPQTAAKERKALLKSVDRLKNFPQSGRRVPEFGNPALREVIRDPIRVIYRVEKGVVQILAFHHAKRGMDLTLFS